MFKLWILRKDFRFEASHQLMHHDGKCQRLHGHSWILTVEIAGPQLEEDGPKRNMLLDYGDIKAATQPLVDSRLDHWHLNDTFLTDSPTSEYLAEVVFSLLQSSLLNLRAIEISETCTSFCRFEYS